MTTQPSVNDITSSAVNDWQRGWTTAEQAITRIAIRLGALARPQVHEHLIRIEEHSGEHATLTAWCGKVWSGSDRSAVDVIGHCPDCEQHVIAGWVA